MKKRTITGLFVAAFFTIVALLTLLAELDFVFDIFVLLLMVFAAIEMARAVSKKATSKTEKPSMALVLSGIAIGYAAFFAVQIHAEGYGILAFFGVQVVVVLAAFVWATIKKAESFALVNATVFVLVYPVMILLFMLLLNYLPGKELRAAGILLLFFVSPFTDVFAYLVGSLVKGPKLCPAISPKKTISGAIGGLVGGMTLAILVYIFAAFGFLEFIGLSLSKLNAAHFVALGFLGSLATQCGDLMASAVKRKFKIKDFGKLLPGHGGIMDRIDGMMLNAVVLYVYLLSLNLSV